VAPTGSFTASTTSGQAPLPVQFSDTSTGGPTAWSWSFGDGTTATTQNPAHTYTAAGTYTVTLTASNAVGSSAPVTATVTVAPAPVAPTASFTASTTSGQAPLPVQFSDTSTGAPTAWSWSFGDGTTATTQNPAHTYTAAGTYTVTLTASNAVGSSAPVTATVTVAPVKIVVGASTTATGNSSAVVVTAPSGRAKGTVLVAQVTADAAPTMSGVPTGWTPVVSPLAVTGGGRLFVYYHVVSDLVSEPASYTWQLSTKERWSATVTAFTGVNPTTPFDTQSSIRTTTTAAKTLLVPGVTTVTAGDLLIGGLGLDSPGVAVTPPAGWTEAVESSSTQNAELAYRSLGAAGPTGDATWSLAKAATSGGWMIALRHA
jgi:PKD repeat protein